MATTHFAFLSSPDTLVIFGVCLVIFGPRKLPEIARTLGRAIREFRKATEDIVGGPAQEVRTAPRLTQTIKLPDSTSAKPQLSTIDPIVSSASSRSSVDAIVEETT